MSALKSIEEQWDGFSAMVFAKTPAGETQRKEMKKAFFAGVWSLFAAIEEIGEEHVTEEQGEAFLNKIKIECKEFQKQIMREYAETN